MKVIIDRELGKYALCAVLIILAIVALVWLLSDNLGMLFDTSTLPLPVQIPADG